MTDRRPAGDRAASLTSSTTAAPTSRHCADTLEDFNYRQANARVLGCNAAAGAVGTIMSNTPTQRGLPPELDHERRAQLIAQLHKRAIATANNLLTQRKAIEAGIAKDAWRRKAEAWMIAAGALVVALGCILVALWH